MTTQTSFKAAQSDSSQSWRSTGWYEDPSRNTNVGSAPTPPVKSAAGGLLGRTYLVLLMTPVVWILLFVFADIASRDAMWALPKPLGFLLTAAILLVFSVPTVAVVALALMAWRRERSWMGFPVTLAFGLQVWAVTAVQTPVLLFITIGVGLAVTAWAKRRRRTLTPAMPETGELLTAGGQPSARRNYLP